MIIFVINLIPIFSFSCFIMGLNRCDTLFYTILLILLLHLAKLSFDGNFTTSAELHVIRYTRRYLSAHGLIYTLESKILCSCPKWLVKGSKPMGTNFPPCLLPRVPHLSSPLNTITAFKAWKLHIFRMLIKVCLLHSQWCFWGCTK